MQTLTEKVIKLAPPFGLFNGTVVGNLFPDSNEDARKLMIHRAVHANEIQRLKRGLYILAREYRKTTPHPYMIAALLHAPSHISLETALSFYGLIPEAVFQVSSITSSRSRFFNTPMGLFTFQRVPTRNPRSGVESVKLSEDSWVFIAKPLRAITDLIYLSKEILWETDGLRFLTESMRMEDEDISQIDFSPYNEILNGLRDKRTIHYLAEMKKELQR
jgi:predicted transcriptional regulator of viral defense system